MRPLPVTHQRLLEPLALPFIKAAVQTRLALRTDEVTRLKGDARVVEHQRGVAIARRAPELGIFARNQPGDFERLALERRRVQVAGRLLVLLRVAKAADARFERRALPGHPRVIRLAAFARL